MKSLHALREIYALNTRLLLNCLDGVTDEQAQQRVTDSTNSLAFLACHLTDARCFLGEYLGSHIGNPHSALLTVARGIEDIPEFPPMSVIRKEWSSVARELAGILEGLSESTVAVASSQRFPVDDSTVLGGVTFLAQHESYHIGQMALLRKALGLEAMKY